MSNNLDSALVNDTLVPIFQNSAMYPQVYGNANIGLGAAGQTLPGNANNGSAPDAMSNAAQSPATPGPATGNSPSGTILGIPDVAFYVLLFGAVGYLFLWHVHFGTSASVSA